MMTGLSLAGATEWHIREGMNTMRLLKDMLLGSAACFAAETGTGSVQVAAADKVLDLVAKANDEADFSTELEAFVEHDEEAKFGPVTFGLLLQDIYGDDLHGFAIPGVDETTNEYHAEKYKVRVSKGGESKDENRNFFTVFYNATTIGAALLARKAELTESKKVGADMSLVTAADIKANINDKRWIDAEIKLCDSRMQAGRKLIRTSAEIIFSMKRINDLETVGAKLDMYDVDGKETLRRTKSPVVIYSRLEGETHKYMIVSVSQLVTLAKPENLGKAKEAGGKFDHLADILRREGGSGQGGGDKGPAIIETIATFHDFLNRVATYVDFESEDGKKHHAAILKQLASKDSDELVLAIGTAYLNLDSLYGKIEDRYNKLIAGKAGSVDTAKAA